jgi:RES domain-containing protein
MFGGRWNPPDTVNTIYLASSRACAEAELHRLLDRQARGTVSFPRSVHRLRAHSLIGIDLRPPGALDSVGLTPDDLIDDDWAACQVVGNAVQYLGYTALFAPSATEIGDVIAVYEPHLRPGQLELITTTQIAGPPTS